MRQGASHPEARRRFWRVVIPVEHGSPARSSSTRSFGSGNTGAVAKRLGPPFRSEQFEALTRPICDVADKSVCQGPSSLDRTRRWCPAAGQEGRKGARAFRHQSSRWAGSGRRLAFRCRRRFAARVRPRHGFGRGRRRSIHRMGRAGSGARCLLNWLDLLALRSARRAGTHRRAFAASPVSAWPGVGA